MRHTEIIRLKMHKCHSNQEQICINYLLASASVQLHFLSVFFFFLSFCLYLNKSSADEISNCSLPFSNEGGRRTGREGGGGGGEGERMGKIETFRALNLAFNGFRCARFNRWREPDGSGRQSH